MQAHKARTHSCLRSRWQVGMSSRLSSSANSLLDSLMVSGSRYKGLAMVRVVVARSEAGWEERKPKMNHK